ncbi:MAG: hypothetical protein MJ210_04575, partial [Alphaproteobacteria bacterium]|nr:hypothetical protein [Alphaproteobacteria bacterium]
AALARERAMNKASRAAITSLAQRISTVEGAEKIAAMTDPQLVNFIKETSVINEITSETRYQADLRISVNEDLLKQYMEERDIPLLNPKDRKRIVIIPLFREFQEDEPKLWESENPWRKAWKNAAINSSADFILLPISGEASSVINTDLAKQADKEALEKIKNLSAANDVYVLNTTYDGIEGLITNADSWSGNHLTIKTSGAKSSGDTLFNTAVEDSVRVLSNLAVTAPTITPPTEETISIFFPFSNLSEWVAAEQKIKTIKMISDLQVLAMMQGQIQIKISYSGDFKSLQKEFKQKGFNLSQNEDKNTLIQNNKED